MNRFGDVYSMSGAAARTGEFNKNKIKNYEIKN